MKKMTLILEIRSKKILFTGNSSRLAVGRYGIYLLI
jgi:hypothetical protein